MKRDYYYTMVVRTGEHHISDIAGRIAQMPEEFKSFEAPPKYLQMDDEEGEFVLQPCNTEKWTNDTEIMTRLSIEFPYANFTVLIETKEPRSTKERMYQFGRMCERRASYKMSEWSKPQDFLPSERIIGIVYNAMCNCIESYYAEKPEEARYDLKLLATKVVEALEEKR